MGQQTILLIALGAIVVGIAVLVGIQMFSDSAARMNIDATVAELTDYASHAQAHYRKPGTMGGGGNSFNGWSLGDATARRKGRRRRPSRTLFGPDTTENAIYTAVVRAQSVTITGNCRVAEKANGGPVSVVTTVRPASFSTQVNK